MNAFQFVLNTLMGLLLSDSKKFKIKIKSDIFKFFHPNSDTTEQIFLIYEYVEFEL